MGIYRAEIKRCIRETPPNDMPGLTSASDELLRDAPFPGVVELPTEARAHGTIVLAHGFALSARSYRELAAAWAGAGWAVYVPALYGVCTAVGADADALGRACTWAYAALPRPLVLAGHSRGGQAALVHLLRQHSRRGAKVGPPLAAYRGLLLLDPCEGAPRTPLGCGLRHFILDAAGLDWKWSDIPVVLLQNRGCVPPGHDAKALYSALRAATLVGGGNWEYGDAPFYLINATKFGHLDYLDDAVGPVATVAAWLVGGEKAKRGLLRRYTTDLVTAVFHPGANRRDVLARVVEVERRICNA